MRGRGSGEGSACSALTPGGAGAARPQPYRAASATPLCTISGAQSQAAEQGLLTHRMLPLNLQIEAARGAIQACAARHYQISVVIVDAYGNTRLLVVSDDAIYTTASSARRKAYTAVMMRDRRPMCSG